MFPSRLINDRESYYDVVLFGRGVHFDLLLPTEITCCGIFSLNFWIMFKLSKLGQSIIVGVVLVVIKLIFLSGFKSKIEKYWILYSSYFLWR